MASTAWSNFAKKNAILRYIDANLRGASQVFLQNNALAGLIILLAIFWGAFATGNPNVAFGAVVGLLVSTAMGMLLKMDRASSELGIFGMSGILVGVAIPGFLANHPLMWAYLVIGAAVSAIITLAVANIVKTWGIPGSTAPFVFTTWLLLLGGYSFAKMPIFTAGRASLAAGVGTLLSWHALLSILSKNISQVFLIGNAVTGILFLIALAISSVRSALFAIIGSVLSFGVALLFGVEATALAAGLYGFNAVLTAIAVGVVLQRPSFRTTLYALLATVFTVIVQAALEKALSPIGIPVLTFPYVLTMWIFLLPKTGMAKATASG